LFSSKAFIYNLVFEWTRENDNSDIDNAEELFEWNNNEVKPESAI